MEARWMDEKQIKDGARRGAEGRMILLLILMNT